MRPRKRLVMSIFMLAAEDASVNALAAALKASGVGSRYSKAEERMMLRSWIGQRMIQRQVKSQLWTDVVGAFEVSDKHPRVARMQMHFFPEQRFQIFSSSCIVHGRVLRTSWAALVVRYAEILWKVTPSRCEMETRWPLTPYPIRIFPSRSGGERTFGANCLGGGVLTKDTDERESLLIEDDGSSQGHGISTNLP